MPCTGGTGIMTDPGPKAGRAVPSGRLARIAAMGSLATGIGGAVLAGGARQLATGQRPRLSDLVLTPGNARRVADQLAHLRGAAMKMGQLLSMDAGEVLPPELAAILSRLRSDADPMPPQQLRRVLDAVWGQGWLARFQRFDVRPIAAASIGQVHRAQTRDGRDLAIKVQYPGIRASIDSDVDNVATLLRLSGMVPARLDLRPLLEEAKRQLHEEADYRREAAQMQRFAGLLAGDAAFRVPVAQADWSTDSVLAMDFIDSQPIEALTSAPQAERDRVARDLIRLVLAEVFDFNLMQTDPNFANFRYSPSDGRIVLLDFGSTRSFGPDIAPGLRQLLRAGVAGEDAGVMAVLDRLGFLPADMSAPHRAEVAALARIGFAPLRQGGVFDFARRDFLAEMRERGMALGLDRDLWHVPPPDLLFLNRKFGGLYLLATKLAARVDLDPLIAPYLA